jgi:asparagine synthase (glutamine-hydrolysing)
MCGIVGIVGLDVEPTQSRALVSRMAEHIRHRGPDGGGVVAHQDVVLGMTRLAIVDVVHGVQPMANDDESIVIVYNGEVYNAPELRREMEQRGTRFRTHSDTEVVLRLYEMDPDRVEEHLVGMWAFAIHDRRRRRVVVSRDRFGIKPLFIADTGTALAFASELRCFDRSLQPFARLFGIDHDAAHAMMSWSYVPETATIYKGVKRLAPGTRLTVDLSTGNRETRTYWLLEPSEEAARVRSLDEACEQVDRLLRRAVRQHLESDVPVATFLSGGIDSSLATAYAHEESKAPIVAYSIGFDERGFDESPFARETAQRIGVPICVETFGEAEARARLADALLAYDEPFGDSSSLATYLLAAHVGRNFKVAIGGDGGDEVFAGYRKYMLVHLRRPLATVPALRNAIGRALRHFGRLHTVGDDSSAWVTFVRRVRKTGSGLDGTDARVYAELSQWAPLVRTAALMRQPSTATRFLDDAQARFNQAHGTELQRTLAADLGNILSNQMLVKIDRASMACSLEARVPFLDHRLVEFGVGLPERFTVGPSGERFRGKRVLRALHERRFGSALAQRRKQGFSVPIRQWLQGPFARACERLFEKRRLDRFGILSSDALSDGKVRHWISGPEPYIAWYAFALTAWCEATLGDGPDSLRDLIDESLAAPAAISADRHLRASQS